MKFIFLILFFVVFELLGFYLNLLLLLNILIILIVWFNFIYSYFGLTAQECYLRAKEPIKFKLSPIYILKVIIRGIKIKYIIIKTLLYNLLTKKITVKNFINIIIVVTISFLLVRYYRLEVINALKLEELVTDLITIISAFIGINIPNYSYLYIMEFKWGKERKNVIESLVSYMKRTKDEFLKKIKVDLSSEVLNTKLEIRSKLPNVEPFRLSKYVENNGYSVLRSLAHNFRRTFTGFEVFDPHDPYPCEELLNQSTPEKKLEHYQKYVYEINQCRRIYEIDEVEKKNVEKIINAVDLSLTNEIVPYVAKDLNYYYFDNLENKKTKIDPRHICFEITYGEVLREYFEERNCTITFLNANGSIAEPDFVVIPKNGGLPQFGQIKFRGDYKGLRREIPESIIKYEKTDLSVFFVQDQMLLEKKIYDNPEDLKNRKVIEVERDQRPLINPYMINVSKKPKPYSFPFSNKEWNRIKEMIELQTYILQVEQDKKIIEQKT